MRTRRLAALTTLALVGAPATAHALYYDSDLPREPGRVLVAFEPTVTPSTAAARIAGAGAQPLRHLGPTGHHLAQTGSDPGDKIRKRLESAPGVRYVQPNYLYEDRSSSEPLFGDQWALHNTGQAWRSRPSALSAEPRPDADIDAPEAWAAMGPVSTPVTVAIVDSDFDLRHPEFTGMLWENPADPPNGLDDDGNGLVDDHHGAKFTGTSASGNPHVDGGSHGTSVAGVVGARRDNGVGIAGIAGLPAHARLMLVSRTGGVSCAPTGSCASTAANIEAWNYAVDHGARVINNSWGMPHGWVNSHEAVLVDPALREASQRASDADVVQVFAGIWSPFHPSPDAWDSFDYPGTIRVTASVRSDERHPDHAGHPVEVEIGAPGDEITAPLGAAGYNPEFGHTSAAAPHVTGAAALIRAAYPGLSAAEVVDALVRSVDPTLGMREATSSGGRLNAARALQVAGATP